MIAHLGIAKHYPDCLVAVYMPGGSDQQKSKVDRWLKTEQDFAIVSLTLHTQYSAILAVSNAHGRVLIPEISLTRVNFAAAVTPSSSSTDNATAILTLTINQGAGSQTSISIRFPNHDAALDCSSLLKGLKQGFVCNAPAPLPTSEKNPPEGTSKGSNAALESALALLTSSDPQAIGEKIYGKLEFESCMHQISQLLGHTA